MIRVTKFKAEYKTLWDEFIAKSRTEIFLFYRNYMDYHSDRFTDFSLMFFEAEKLVAVMPGNSKHETLYSHGGLTFGGVISDYKIKTAVMLDIFNVMMVYLKSLNISTLIYKAIPYIYHNVPAEEDMYALFFHNAKLIRRDVSSTISSQERISFSKGRKWCINKSKGYSLEVKRSYEFKYFMEIEESLLKNKYDVKPTHTSDEIQLLANRFPENIKLFTAHKAETLMAGVIIYESRNVAHAQYIAASDEGKQIGSLDYILDFLINEYYAKKAYFDFGISTEKEGRYLNRGLIENKESFGARAVVYDVYQLDI